MFSFAKEGNWQSTLEDSSSNICKPQLLRRERQVLQQRWCLFLWDKALLGSSGLSRTLHVKQVALELAAGTPASGVLDYRHASVAVSGAPFIYFCISDRVSNWPVPLKLWSSNLPSRGGCRPGPPGLASFVFLEPRLAWISLGSPGWPCCSGMKTWYQISNTQVNQNTVSASLVLGLWVSTEDSRNKHRNIEI